MNEYEKTQLMRIYNVLLLIETKGESTMAMADCLRALQDLIKQTDSGKGA